MGPLISQMSFHSLDSNDIVEEHPEVEEIAYVQLTIGVPRPDHLKELLNLTDGNEADAIYHVQSDYFQSESVSILVTHTCLCGFFQTIVVISVISSIRHTNGCWITGKDINDEQFLATKFSLQT